MEDSESWLTSYPPGTVVWVKLKSFPWWPAEVSEHTVTQAKNKGRAKAVLIDTYADEERDCILSPAAIKRYNCTERKALIENGHKKYKSKTSIYKELFSKAVQIADDKTFGDCNGMEIEKVNIDAPELHKGNESKFQNSASSETLPLSNHSHSSTPSKACPNGTHTTPNGSMQEHLKNSPLNGTSGDHKGLKPRDLFNSSGHEKNSTKKRKRKNSGGGRAMKKVKKEETAVAVDRSLTASASDVESEDDLPAVLLRSQTPKSYFTLTEASEGDIVWVKHQTDPFWPSLVMKNGTSQRVCVRFFAYGGKEYPVKKSKRIRPFLCPDKEKLEKEGQGTKLFKEALGEAYLLLRSRGSEDFKGRANQQYSAIKKRRSRLQGTPVMRITVEDSDDSCTEDEMPAQSAFGFTIPSTLPTNAEDVEEVNDIDTVSTFPDGSPYTYSIMREMFIKSKPELQSIFNAKIQSKNHQIFVSGSTQEKNELRIQNRCGPLRYLHTNHWNALQDMMIQWVKDWAKSENKSVHETGYISDVLFPEAAVRTMSAVENLTRDEAWKKFLSI